MALSKDDLDLIAQLQLELRRTRRQDLLLNRYYRLRQRVEQLGMAVPPNMRRFLVIANWPRVVVDKVVARQKVRSLVLPGEETADPTLRAIWDANNLNAHLQMFCSDARVYGRAFMSVGANERNPDLPFMRVEPPMSVAMLVDRRTEDPIAAARFYADKRGMSPNRATLYVPGRTIPVRLGGARAWELDGEVDEHGFPIPIVMHLNGRLSGEWEGESAMTDIIPFTDAAARSLTNLQFAQEAHGIPRMWMTGVAKGDFVDEKGDPIPQFEAYFDAIQTLGSKDAKIGQLTAADLKNFETALNIYGKQASIVTGFPARYFGLTTTNPSSADAIRADEADLVTKVEADNDQVGMTLGWASALAYRFSTGDEIEGNRVQVDWFDPATPTIAQRTDALVKMRQVGALSREGLWDELGWSEARKAKERAYFEEEGLNDPELAAARALTGGNQPAVPSGNAG